MGFQSGVQSEVRGGINSFIHRDYLGTVRFRVHMGVWGTIRGLGYHPKGLGYHACKRMGDTFKRLGWG